MVKSERGIALALVLMALVVSGALIAGILLGGTQEQRVADNTRNSEQAFGTAETGAYEVVRMWSPSRMSFHGLIGADSIPISDSLSPWQTGRYGGRVYKLSNDLYLIDVTGRDSVGLRPRIRGDVPARSHQVLIVRVRPFMLPAPAGVAAVTTGSAGISMGGNSEVSGYDSTPPTWTSCPPSDSAIGILSSGPITLGTKGVAVSGNPATKLDNTIADSTFKRFQDVTYAQLAGAAITLPAGSYKSGPAVTNGVCAINNQLNWGDGDHTQPCGGYFPMIHIAGNATLTGTGQGVLLVDGDVNLTGNFEWFGALIVQGAMKAAGGGNVETTLWGIALINGGLDESQVTGKSHFRYSKCVLTQVLEGTSPVAMARSRGWAQLY
jgi:hypothetical protein